MGLGNAAQNQLIVRVGIENPVFQHRNVGMRTFRYNIPAVEHGLAHAGQLGALGGHNAGQQVQRFDVAVVKASVLLRVQADGLVGVVQGVGPDGNPQLAGHAFLIHMVAGLHTAGDLPVYKVDLAVHLGQQVGQQPAQLDLAHRDVDIQCLGAGKKAVQVVLQQVYLAVRANGGIVAAIAKKVNAIIERHHQFFRCADFAIIICNGFHFPLLLSSWLPLCSAVIWLSHQISVQSLF